MGTLRWEREREMAAERERVRAKLERRRQALKLVEAEAEAREEMWRSQRHVIRRQRGSDQELDESERGA
jgi:hypothetical protein